MLRKQRRVRGRWFEVSVKTRIAQPLRNLPVGVKVTIINTACYSGHWEGLSPRGNSVEVSALTIPALFTSQILPEDTLGEIGRAHV